MDEHLLDLSKTKLRILDYLRQGDGESPLDILLNSIQVENPSKTIYSEILELIHLKIIQIRRNELGIMVCLEKSKVSADPNENKNLQ